ncbi:hypothetical protein ILP92_09430 [Maribius pontilimi]|uniref:Uncharacterized protein n=1 Tax=Palleronia pontilimi TaxID=1964209 RepID=A0A934MCM7_9RHOB|nr:hypothetical protein [Palleronia pontilimi]MBJ3762963.1 hypothetical protein [Palleronia pontilimi]
MQWDTIKQNWSAFIAPIMQRWEKTEENDLLTLDGNRDRFEAYLVEREGLSETDARDQVNDWMQGAAPADVVMDESRDGENIRASAAHIGVGEDVYADDKDFGDDNKTERPIGRNT